jgi:hypothetical protein
MMVYDAETAMAVTAATDMVTLVPRRYAEACPSSAQIRIIDFPQDHAEMIELSMMLWHSRVHDDPGSLWLRALIREAVNLSSNPLQPRESVNRTRASLSAGKVSQKSAGSHPKLPRQPCCRKLGSLLLMNQLHNAPEKRALSVTMLRVVGYNRDSPEHPAF